MNTGEQEERCSFLKCGREAKEYLDFILALMSQKWSNYILVDHI